MGQKKIASEYADLFKGNDRSYGVWIPDTLKMMTEKAGVGEKQYLDHLKGVRGLGLVPIMDSGLCWFGAIDIDNHGDVEDINLAEVIKKIETKNLPLIACRSKSGGVHAYVFCREPVRAKSLRLAMEKWAIDIGFPRAELFPKQDHLDKDVDGELRLGNWINLCYFDVNDTVRYTLNPDGSKASIEQFISMAQAKRAHPDQISVAENAAHAGAPPCIKKMLASGVGKGVRNDALYNIVVYLKRANPNTYLDDALDINNSVFQPPLSTSEAKVVIKSASRRDYKYKCGIAPCKELCDSKVCVEQEFGIPKSEYDEMNAVSMLPEFSDVVKFDTDPVKWGITVNKTKMITNIPTEALYNFEILKQRITESLMIGVPSITKRSWERTIIPLISSARVVEIPDDASISGIIGNRLREFLDKANTAVTDEVKEPEKLLRGIPCVMPIKAAGEKCMVFRVMDFTKYLKAVKAEDVKGPNLWFALKSIPKLGIDHTRISVKGKKMTVWYVPMSSYDKPEHSMPEFRADF